MTTQTTNGEEKMTTLSLGQIEHLRMSAKSFEAVSLGKVKIAVEVCGNKIGRLHFTNGEHSLWSSRLELADKTFIQLVTMLNDGFFAMLKESKSA